MKNFMFVVFTLLISVNSFAQGSVRHGHGGESGSLVGEMIVVETIANLRVFLVKNPNSVGSVEVAKLLEQAMAQTKVIVKEGHDDDTYPYDDVRAILANNEDLYKVDFDNGKGWSIQAYSDVVVLLNQNNPRMVYEETIKALAKVAKINLNLKVVPSDQTNQTFKLEVIK